MIGSIMMSRKAQMGIVVAFLIVLVLGGIAFYWYNSGNMQSSYSSSSNEGRIVFAMTDAAANMGSVSSVKVTVDNIKVHSNSQGWVDLSSSAKTYDLIELKNNNELAVIADSNVESGKYDQVRFEVTKVIVVDSEGEHEAKLPSSELKINSELNVDENSTATATFDFIADESLHVTGSGKYILAPVIQVETRSNTEVESKGNSRVEVKGGNVDTKTKVGMDINGNVGVGLGIAANSNLDIDSSGILKVKGNSNSGIGIGY